MKTIQRHSMLIAALLATAGVAHAQAPLPTTTRPGEATTMQGGQPNPPQKASGVESREAVRATGAAAARAGDNNMGEASTNSKGNPNMGERATGQNSRAAVREEAKTHAKGPMKNSNLPPAAGEASTTGPNGQANRMPTSTTPTPVR